MHVRRLTSLLAILGLVVLPALARSAEASKTRAPAMVVQVKSIDELIADGKYLANLAGQDDKAKQMEQFLDSMRNEKGLQGIDTKRPLGFYGSFGEEGAETTGLVLLPIADQAGFLDLIERFGQEVKKGDDGIYTATSEKLPVPVYFRFAHDYVYATSPNKAALDKDKLLDPAKVLSSNRVSTVSAVFHLDQIPDGFKQIALQMMDQEASKAKDREQPGETEQQRKVRIQATEYTMGQFAAFIKEGNTLEARMDVDRKAQELVAQLNITAKPDSKLEASITGLGQAKSLFAGLAGSDSALNMVLHVALPASLRKAMEPVIDEEVSKGLAKEQDEAKRELAKKFLKTLEPTLKAGELDVGFALRGPSEDKHYTFVAGIKLKDGEALDKAVRELVGTLPEKDQQKIKLDAESEGDVKITRVEAQKDYDAGARRMMGENPLYVAIRNDAAMVGGGPDGLAALKEALTAQAKAGPQFQFEVSLSRLATLMTDEHPNAVSAADKAFGAAGKNNDTIHISVEGGSSLKLAFAMKAPAVKFFSLLQNSGKAVGKPRKPISTQPIEKPQPVPEDK